MLHTLYYYDRPSTRWRGGGGGDKASSVVCILTVRCTTEELPGVLWVYCKTHCFHVVSIFYMIIIILRVLLCAGEGIFCGLIRSASSFLPADRIAVALRGVQGRREITSQAESPMMIRFDWPPNDAFFIPACSIIAAAGHFADKGGARRSIMKRSTFLWRPGRLVGLESLLGGVIKWVTSEFVCSMLDGVFYRAGNIEST